MVVGGAEHEGITLGRRGYTNVGGHKLVGMNIGVNFDAALLFSGLRMPPDAFDNEIGEERNGRRIDDLQAFDPLWTTAPSAVRGNHVLRSGVQLSEMASKIHSLRRRLASESGERRSMALMPKCPNLLASGNIETTISHRESKCLTTA